MSAIGISIRRGKWRSANRAGRPLGRCPPPAHWARRPAARISIYFLAARQPPKMIENPRQTSAYHYPPKFGKHSPIFSRACVWGEPGSARLFVSGTASIVGHETIHRGDVVAQTRETMVNIGALLEEANRIVGSSPLLDGRSQAESLCAKSGGSCRDQAALSLSLSPATTCPVPASRRLPRGFAGGNRSGRLAGGERGKHGANREPRFTIK